MIAFVQVGYFPADCIKVLNNQADVERYYRRLSEPVSDARANAKQVSSIFGKNVLMLKKRLEGRPKIEELKNMSVYQNRASLKLLTHEGWEYPAIVELCTEFVRRHCIVQGVYRKSCNAKKLALLNELFWTKKFPKSITELKEFCQANSDFLCVASFIKQLFRDLAEPLIPSASYESMLQLYDKHELNKSSHSNEQIFSNSLGQIVKQMDDVNSATFMLLISHFRKLLEHVDQTSMDSENLSRVWAPNLFPHVTKSTGDTQETVMPVRIQSFILSRMITDAPTVFDLNKHPLSASQRSYSLVNLVG